MKYRDLVKKLEAMGFEFDHHGARHDIFRRGSETRQVPRHKEINEVTAQEILKGRK